MNVHYVSQVIAVLFVLSSTWASTLYAYISLSVYRFSPPCPLRSTQALCADDPSLSPGYWCLVPDVLDPDFCPPGVQSLFPALLSLCVCSFLLKMMCLSLGGFVLYFLFTVEGNVAPGSYSTVCLLCTVLSPSLSMCLIVCTQYQCALCLSIRDDGSPLSCSFGGFFRFHFSHGFF